MGAFGVQGQKPNAKLMPPKSFQIASGRAFRPIYSTIWHVLFRSDWQPLTLGLLRATWQWWEGIGQLKWQSLHSGTAGSRDGGDDHGDDGGSDGCCGW